MKSKVKYQILLSLLTAAMLSCKSGSESNPNTVSIRILDIQLLDADTGLRPTKGGILLGPPEPSPDGPFVQETPVQENDPNRYRVRVTWIQSKPVDQTIRIQVTGYEPYTATMEDIQTFDSWTSIGGQIEKNVKIKRIK